MGWKPGSGTLPERRAAKAVVGVSEGGWGRVDVARQLAQAEAWR